MLITEIQDLGGLGYLVFAGLMIFLQAAPPHRHHRHHRHAPMLCPLPSPRHLPPPSPAPTVWPRWFPLPPPSFSPSLLAPSSAASRAQRWSSHARRSPPPSPLLSRGVSEENSCSRPRRSRHSEPRSPHAPHPQRRACAPGVYPVHLMCTFAHLRFKTLDDAFSNASYGTSLLLISLLRLSPVLPFSWANYIFGLSPVPFTAFSLGTFLGCLPAVAAYVNAGKLGAEIVVSRAPRHAPEPRLRALPPSFAPPLRRPSTTPSPHTHRSTVRRVTTPWSSSACSPPSQRLVLQARQPLPHLAPRASPRAPAWLGWGGRVCATAC